MNPLKNLTLIEGWQKLWKSWSMQLAALGLALPELLQLIADNTELLTGFDVGYKSLIRMGCLIGVLLLRPVKQAALTPKDTP